jgi:hypothetical protein
VAQGRPPQPTPGGWGVVQGGKTLTSPSAGETFSHKAGCKRVPHSGGTALVCAVCARQGSLTGNVDASDVDAAQVLAAPAATAHHDLWRALQHRAGGAGGAGGRGRQALRVPAVALICGLCSSRQVAGNAGHKGANQLHSCAALHFRCAPAAQHFGEGSPAGRRGRRAGRALAQRSRRS